jgi:chaperonin GroEL
MAEGIVPGGGVALVRAAASLDKIRTDGDEQIGIDLVGRAITAPCRRIAENAAADGAATLQTVRKGQGAFGFNATTGEYEDLIDADIVDLTMSVRLALQNAAAAASALLVNEQVHAQIERADNAAR